MRHKRKNKNGNDHRRCNLLSGWLGLVQKARLGRHVRRVRKIASRPVVKTLDRYAVKNWRAAPKFGSLWLSLLMSALSGAWIALPAFQYVLPPIRFGMVCVALGLLIGAVRLVRQSGVDD